MAPLATKVIATIGKVAASEVGKTVIASTASAIATKSVLKSVAPTPPPAPTQAPAAPTAISTGTQGQNDPNLGPADLLSTILAGGQKRKNQLG